MNLFKRTATAVVILPLLFVSIQYFSSLGFLLLIQVPILAALLEFYRLPRHKDIVPDSVPGVIFALIISAAFYFPAFPITMALFSGLIFFGLFYLITINRLEDLVSYPIRVSMTIFGAFYLSFTLNHFLPLREFFGPEYIYFMLGVIFVGDTGAMLVGHRWGKHKLAPMASPNKTWEGSAAGVITGCLTGVAAQQLLLQGEMSIWQAVVYAFLIQAVAQISDPTESLFKRAVGVKDSSNLLPGHGGFLDRVDSLILATPFFYYLLMVFHTRG
jgi:phosphatidate cytidylyltransferase